MALTFVGTNTAGTGGPGASSATVTSPGSLQVNDLIIVSIAVFNNTSLVAQASAGWTLLTPSALCSSNQCGLYYKLATSGDVAAANWSFNFSPTCSYSYIAIAVRGANPTTPVSSATESSNTSPNTGQTIGTKSESSGNSIYFTFISSQKTSTGQFTDSNQTVLQEQIGPAQPAMTSLFTNTFSGTSASISYSCTAVNNTYIAFVINNFNPLGLIIL